MKSSKELAYTYYKLQGMILVGNFEFLKGQLSASIFCMEINFPVGKCRNLGISPGIVGKNCNCFCLRIRAVGT